MYHANTPAPRFIANQAMIHQGLRVHGAVGDIRLDVSDLLEAEDLPMPTAGQIAGAQPRLKTRPNREVGWPIAVYGIPKGWKDGGRGGKQWCRHTRTKGKGRHGQMASERRIWDPEMFESFYEEEAETA